MLARKLWDRVLSCRDVALECRWRLSREGESPAGISRADRGGDEEDLAIRWPRAYGWVDARIWVDPLLEGFRRIAKVEVADIPQPFPGIVVFQVGRVGDAREVAVDYSDDSERIDGRCLARVALYFKMQFRRGGYGSEKVVPGGYVGASPMIYRYLRHLRRLKDGEAPLFDVYGRFGLEFAGDLRKQAVRRLTEQGRFRFEGSLGIVRYSRSLREVARARICIDLPGKGDFCFRLVDYLAIGACVIGPRHRTTLPVPLEDREHVVYTRDDLSDLIPLCERYLDDAAAREEVTRKSRDYFDRHLHRDPLVRYYLEQARARLGLDRGPRSSGSRCRG